MNIAIVDDEVIWQKTVKEYLLNYFQDITPEIDIYSSGRDFLETKKEYNIVFMDIELRDESGFDISLEYKQIFPDVLLVIITTHAELSRMGYRVNAFRYIDKLHLEELDEAMNSMEKRWLQDEKISLHLNTGDDIKISCKDIYYIEADNHNVVVKTRNQSFVCCEKIYELQKQLEKNGFYLIHRAYLINMRYVEKMSSKELKMNTGVELPISRRKYSEFSQNYIKWKLERGNG